MSSLSFHWKDLLQDCVGTGDGGLFFFFFSSRCVAVLVVRQFDVSAGRRFVVAFHFSGCEIRETWRQMPERNEYVCVLCMSFAHDS